MMKKYRIGAGAGFASDRLDAAETVINEGEVDALTLEVLAERTLALQQIEKQHGRLGYWHLLESYLNKLLPACVNKGIRIVSNCGGADPVSASRSVVEVALLNGLFGAKVATVTGDDVIEYVLEDDPILFETNKPLSESTKEQVISANAYIGSSGIREGVRQGANIIVGGRLTDSALALGACADALGWEPDDYNKIAAGVVAGHLTECAAQISGGYFADPPIKKVPNIEMLGFPIIDINQDGGLFVTKVQGTGGLVSRRTVVEQLLYEIHDPTTYMTPDVIVDLSEVDVSEVKGGVLVTGIKGRKPPATLKVLLGVENGIVVEGGISYAGINAEERARVAGEILRKRLDRIGVGAKDIFFRLIGVNSSWVIGSLAVAPYDVRLHIGVRVHDPQWVALVQAEIEGLYTNGPAGGGGIRYSNRSSLRIYSCFIPSEEVHVETKVTVC